MGYGVSVSGKINFDTDKRYDLRFMATYGSGIGRYVGLNFAPDAIFVPGVNHLRPVKSFASFAALRLGWTPTLRSTLMASYQNAKYPGGFPVGAFNAYNNEAWSVAGNLFWSPVKGFDLGVEYRHGERILVSGANGSLTELNSPRNIVSNNQRERDNGNCSDELYPSTMQRRKAKSMSSSHRRLGRFLNGMISTFTACWPRLFPPSFFRA